MKTAGMYNETENVRMINVFGLFLLGPHQHHRTVRNMHAIRRRKRYAVHGGEWETNALDLEGLVQVVSSLTFRLQPCITLRLVALIQRHQRVICVCPVSLVHLGLGEDEHACMSAHVSHAPNT